MHQPGMSRFVMGGRFFLRITVLIGFACGVSSLLGPSSSAAPPQQAPPSEPIPATYFGMSIGIGAGWPPLPFGALGKGPATTWAFLEPSKGHYDWSRLDALVNQAQAHGMPMFYSTDYVPKWAAIDKSSCRPAVFNNTVCRSTAANIQDWDDFVTALATRYKGKIDMYELWNEPDQPEESTATVGQMVTLTNHMYKIIRSIDPGALIGSPSIITTQWLDSYWAAGGVHDVDVVTLHGYPGNTPPESICYFRTQPLKAVMAKYGISKPLWDTEDSWGSGDIGRTFSGEQRFAFVARHYLMHWSCGVSRYYWWLWSRGDWGAMIEANGGKNEAAVAYENVQNWMVGATMPQPCVPVKGDKYHATYTCDLTRDGGYQARAVWNTDGSSTYLAPNQFAHYRDLEGRKYAVPSNHQVMISPKPILLENN